MAEERGAWTSVSTRWTCRKVCSGLASTCKSESPPLPESTARDPSIAARGITSDIDLIKIQQINEAYERLLKSDVKYRFVIDMASLKA